jgi:hypothetical protein
VREAASRPMSEPMLWPTSVAACTPAASSRATIQSACASTEASSGHPPAYRECGIWNRARRSIRQEAELIALVAAE